MSCDSNCERLKWLLQNGINIPLDAATKPQKKKTEINIDNDEVPYFFFSIFPDSKIKARKLQRSDTISKNAFLHNVQRQCSTPSGS